MNVTVTTTAFILEHTISWTDYVQAAAAASMVMLTYFIIRYTKLTIREGQLNRRKNSIERQFKEYFYPVMIALTKARTGRADIRKVHNLPTSCYLFTIGELEEITEKVGSFMYSDLKGFAFLRRR